MERRLFTKNFSLLVVGQASSLFGNYILRLALSMYVLEVTGSAAVFAGILSIAVLPTIVLSPLGGILADRADRRNIMVALDTLSGVFIFGTAVLSNKGNALVMIGILLAALSVFGAFETPTVQACIPQMLTGDYIIKGNAVVNQIASISWLTAPALGGIFYAAFGLKPVMYASVLFFFTTAILECFIRLPHRPHSFHGNVSAMIRSDFKDSIRFLMKEDKEIMKLLLLAAISRFFVMGVTLVGLPFLVRTVLNLSAKYYGAAESALAIATIAGSIAAGAATGKLKFQKLHLVLSAIGLCIIPAGVIFLYPVSAVVKYAVIVVSFCGMQAAVSIFSIFAVSMIQQNTPGHLIGKVMAYTSAITMCAQPAGQMVYGFLFDAFSKDVFLILIPTGAVICAAGLLSSGIFRGWKAHSDDI